MYAIFNQLFDKEKQEAVGKKDITEITHKGIDTNQVCNKGKVSREYKSNVLRAVLCQLIAS
jgi:hypothetical protein